MIRKMIIIYAILGILTLPIFGEVPAYKVDLVLEPESGEIRGNFEVTLSEESVHNGRVYLYLMNNLKEKRNPHLFPLLQENGPDGFSPASNRIDDVTIEGRRVSWQYRVTEKRVIQTYGRDHILCEIPLPPGTETPFTLSFSYVSRLPHYKAGDDFYFKDKMISRFGWFPYVGDPEFILEKGGFTFFPFRLEAKIKLQEDWILAALGEQFRRSGDAYFIKNTSPVKSFPIAALKGFKILERPIQGNTKTLRVYHKSNKAGIAALSADYAEDALDYYRRIYYPLAANHISIIQGNPTGAAMAADSVILIDDGRFGGVNRIFPDYCKPMLDHVIAHELGHFYFGIGSAPDHSRENWLSEGLNEYSTIKYIEQKYGVWENRVNTENMDIITGLYHFYTQLRGGTYSRRGNKMSDSGDLQWAGWNTPLSDEPENKLSNARITTDYHKSSLIIDMMARYLGKDSFDRALLSYLNKVGYRLTNTETFKKAMEEFYSKDLDSFFDRHIYGAQWIDYSLKGELNRKVNGEYISLLKVKTASDEFFYPVTLSLFGGGKVMKEVLVETPGTVEVATKYPVSYAGLDKEFEFLDLNRENNFYPSQIAFAPTADPWLKEDGALMWTLDPYFNLNSNQFSLGLGPYFYNPNDGGLLLTPRLTLANDFSTFAFNYNIYGYLLSSKEFSLFSDTLLTAKGNIQYSEWGFVYTPYSEKETGQIGTYQTPSLSFSSVLGAANLDFAAPENSILYNVTTLRANNLSWSGTSFSLSNVLYYFPINATTASEISIDFNQAVSLMPRLMLGLNLRSNILLGDLVYTFPSYSVTGGYGSINFFSNDAGIKLFLGIPFINDIELDLFNLAVFQSITCGLFYDQAFPYSWDFQDFDTAWQYFMVHAAGIEFRTHFRTFLDMPLELDFGFSFLLNSITYAPENPESYIPVFYMSVGTLSDLYHSLSNF